VYLSTTGHDNRVRFFNISALSEADDGEEEDLLHDVLTKRKPTRPKRKGKKKNKKPRGFFSGL
jgi:hypothetical protein